MTSRPGKSGCVNQEPVCYKMDVQNLVVLHGSALQVIYDLHRWCGWAF